MYHDPVTGKFVKEAEAKLQGLSPTTSTQEPLPGRPHEHEWKALGVRAVSRGSVIYWGRCVTCGTEGEFRG